MNKLDGSELYSITVWYDNNNNNGGDTDAGDITYCYANIDL